MKFATTSGRLQLVRGDTLLDVAETSQGQLPSSPLDAYARWGEVLEWARAVSDDAVGRPFSPEELEAPSPQARQVFAVGLNYAPHAKESGFELPTFPFVFTKTFASLAPPFGELALPSDTVDWEVEIVVVIGAPADRVPAETAWDHVAGLTVGQDYSDREVQNRIGPNSQPTLGKSRPGFAPSGPYLVTTDEFENRDDIELWTKVNGVEMQHSTSAELVFNIPALIAYLSSVLPLYPGDLIFTGTPEGVGLGRTPPLYLKPGDVIETFAAGIGSIRQTAVAT